MIRQSYTHLVNQLQHLSDQSPEFTRDLNDLISINELLTTLNTAKTLEQTLDILLLTMLGQYGCHKGAILIKGHDSWRMGICKGCSHNDSDLTCLPTDNSWNDLPSRICPHEDNRPGMEIFQDQFHLVLPIKNEQILVGLICLGKSMFPDGGANRDNFLDTIADFGGVLISNTLSKDNLEQANRQMQRQLFQLNTLYEVSGAFARCLENEEIFQVLANNLMGQFFISRCAVLTFGRNCKVLFQKNVRSKTTRLGKAADLVAIEDWPLEVTEKGEIPCQDVKAFMEKHKLRYGLTISSENRREGILLLGNRLDQKPLTSADKSFVLSLTEQAAAAVENIRLQKEAAEKKRMERELQLAREIQEKLLPKDVPALEGYEIAVEMRSYYHVGGDFYDFIPLADGRMAICLADVSGKSLPAALIMSTAQASLRALNTFETRDPQKVIVELNKHMWASTQSNKFITMFYAVLDIAEHKLTYINAGHNPPILMRPDGTHEMLGLGGMVIGLFPHAPYKVGQVDFDEGSDLLMFTDGLTEVNAGGEEEYGDNRLMETFPKLAGTGTAEECKNKIIEDAMDFSSNATVDDMTIMLLRRRMNDAQNDRKNTAG